MGDDWNARKRAECRAAGICERCYVEPVEKGVQCKACREMSAIKSMARYRAKASKGLCVRCGQPKSRKSVDCSACRGKYARSRKRRAQQRRRLKRLYESTATCATRKSKMWTPEEDAVLKRADLTIEEMALKIGRSFRAVSTRRYVIKAPRREARPGQQCRSGVAVGLEIGQ